MLSAHRFQRFVLVAGILGAALLATPDRSWARPACGCEAADDGYLHRPSTPRERAETARLNREFLAAANAGVSQESKPAGREAGDAQYRQSQYQQDVEQYRAEMQSYDRQLNDYRKGLARSRAAAATPDRHELDPWYGYNNGPQNGY